MKKKFFTSIAVTFVMAAALVAVAPTNAQAAKAINVKVGEKTTIKASKKVTWSIKDTSIATLNKKSGKKVKLTGVKEGSTILTTTDASGKKLDYAVNVKAAETAPAAEEEVELQVFIAASLNNCMQEVAAKYNEEHPNVKIVFNADYSLSNSECCFHIFDIKIISFISINTFNKT